MSCCATESEQGEKTRNGGSPPKKSIDWLFWITSIATALFYGIELLVPGYTGDVSYLPTMSGSVFDLVNTIWWGIALGIIMISVLGVVPREFVISLLGEERGAKGIFRATLGGVLLDLCSHGILMVGAKLYERGASLGQVMAFLIASPWNSFSLTLILIALVGIKWTLVFIVLSFAVAMISGLIFDMLVVRKILPDNPYKQELPDDFRFWHEARKQLSEAPITRRAIAGMFWEGLKESRMVLRWIFVGVLLASLIRTFMDPSMFQTWFGPSIVGLGMTLIAATIIEVCSEGSTPIAADLLTRAGAPGNSFAFLMTGVSTDYTEIMVLRDRTRSWKIALFLPLVTVPQVIALSLLLNQFAVP